MYEKRFALPGKRWLLPLLCVFLAVACGRTGEKAPEQKRFVVALPQWFHPSEERPWLVSLWDSIRQENPGVVFDLQLVPGRTELVLQKLLVACASGERPDLACVKLHWVGDLVKRGLLEPLDGLVPEGRWEELLPAMRSCSLQDGKHYLLPYDLGVRVILYRADLFRQAGLEEPVASWTWDDLVRAAGRLTVDKDGDGRVDQWGFGVPGGRGEKTIFQWLPWFWSLGGRLCEPGVEPLPLRSRAAVEAMQWYRDLAHRYRVTPPAFYSLDQEAVFEGLAGGMFAMAEGGSWEPSMLLEHSPYGSEFRIASLPGPRPGEPGVTLADGWGFVALSRDSWKREALSRVLAALSSREHHLDKLEASDSLPPFAPLYREPRFLRVPQAGVLSRVVDRGRPLPAGSCFAQAAEALEAALQEVLMDGRSPAEALAAQLPGPGGRSGGMDTSKPGLPGSGTPPSDPDAGSEEPSAAKLPRVPAGSLLVRAEGGTERLLGHEELGRLPRVPAGDLSLVPLTALATPDVPRGILLRAADGFEKQVPVSQSAGAFFDPETMRAILVREGDKTFTVRDLAEVVFAAEPGAGGVLVLWRGRERVFSEEELRSLAGQGALSFRHLLEVGGISANEGVSVRLLAGDGYRREVPLESFLQGRLHLEGRQCEFPGAGSKDQVGGLVRVEIP